MLMTEEQAKATWCPMVRIGVMSGASATAVNRDPRPDIQEDCNCIGTQCAAWRWATTGRHEHDCLITGTDLTDTPPKVGYCGLAGRPGVE